MITEEDKVMLRYFWDKKKDIRLYSKYKEISRELGKDYPELLDAFDAYMSSGYLVRRLLDEM